MADNNQIQLKIKYIITCYLKSVIRHAIIILAYPKAGTAFLLKWVGRLPLFKYRVRRDNESLYERKVYLRDNKRNMGHAFKEKKVGLLFGNVKLIEFIITEGAELTAEHFFLNRPIKDVQTLFNLASRYIFIKQSSLIFDPGCGTGRHLFYLVDRYGCKGVGVDVYPPAIKIAQKANLDGRISFYNCSSLKKGLLDDIIPNGCEYVFINSWLNHVYNYDGYSVFIKKLLSSCQYLLLISSSKKYGLEELFPNPVILVEEVQDGTLYALIKGEK
jgi:Methyltransferase domain